MKLLRRNLRRINLHKSNLPKAIYSLNERSANFFMIAHRRKQSDGKVLEAATDRVKIKRYCNVDSSHVARATASVLRGESWNIGGWHVAKE